MIAPPINQIPEELFYDIITLSLADTPPDRFPNRLEELRTVSTSWAAGILTHSRLWAHIVVGTGSTASQVAQLLERSGEGPLTVGIYGSTQGEGMMEAVAAHSHRWQHFRLSCPTRPMEPSLSLPTPRLETLVLGVSTMGEQVVLRNLFGGHAPRLRSIRSSYISSLASSTPELFRNVTELDLTHVEVGEAETYTNMMKIIASCTSLQFLKIGATGPLRTEVRTRRDPIIIPSLQSYHLRVHYPNISPLLHNVQGPQCRTFWLGAVDGVWAMERLDRIYEKVASLMQGELTASGTSSDEFSMYGKGNEVTVILRSAGQMRPMLTRRLFSRMLPKFTRVEISVGNTAALHEWCDSLTRHASSLQEIGIKFEGSGMTHADVGVFYHKWMVFIPISDRSQLKRLDAWEDGRWVDRLPEFQFRSA